MVAFNPDIPETQEPNYLRYSRPSNYAPVNRAAGEAIKSIGQVAGQTARATDSLVTEGIKSSVSRQAEEDQNQYIHGTLEPEYNRLYGTKYGQDQSLLSSYDEATPEQIKALPGKIDALNAYRAKGGFVNTEYTGKLDYLAKDMRSQFPGYRDIIDREVSRASGRGEANPYARNLMSGIERAYSRLDAAKKEDQKWVDEAFKRGLIDPTYMGKFNSGEATADRAKEMLNMDFRREHDHQLRMQGIAEAEGSDKLAHIKGRRAVEGYADDTLNLAMQSYQNFFTRGADPIQHQKDVAEGKVSPMSEQEKLQREQQFNIIADKMGHDIATKTAAAHNVLNEGEAEKITADYRQRFRNWLGMSESKEYAAAPFDIANLAKARNADLDHEFRAKLPTVSDYMDRREYLQKRSDKDWEKYTEHNSFDSSMQPQIKAFVNGRSVVSANPKPDENPSLKEDLGLLDKHGGDGNAKQRLLAIPEQIQGSNSDESKRNWVKYSFSGDNPSIFRDIEVDSRDAKGNIKQGRYSIYENYTNPKMVAAVKALGPESWNTYKEGLTTAFSHSLFGHEIGVLNSASNIGYDVSYNTENGHFAVKSRPGEHLNFDPKEGGRPVKESIDRLNRGIDGLRNVLKGDGSDPNAAILRELNSDRVDLSNVEGIPVKMLNAVMSSHKSSAIAAPGQTMSDAGDQMGMGATAMNIQTQPPVAGEKAPEKLMTQFPARTQAPGPVNIKEAPSVPGTFNPAQLGREIKPQLPAQESTPNLNPSSAGANVNVNQILKEQGLPTQPLEKIQKKLDTTLKKAGEHAKAYTRSVEDQYRSAEENIFTREASADSILARFKDHPREEELLNQKIDSLKLRSKNFGPKSPQGQLARQDIKLIQKRLKDIDVGRVGDQLEKDIGKKVKEEFK